jgi:hypothetical protein
VDVWFVLIQCVRQFQSEIIEFKNLSFPCNGRSAFKFSVAQLLTFVFFLKLETIERVSDFFHDKIRATLRVRNSTIFSQFVKYLDYSTSNHYKTRVQTM